MNREILFRGKRIDNGEWVEGYYCPNTIFPIETLNKCWEGVKINSDTLGQYTGLTDKNGVKKFFEGDIIKGNGKVVYVVEYSQNIAGYIFSMNTGSMKCYEVIGNIYDNPELLSEEVYTNP